MPLILKSRGNWWDGTEMLNREELAELGLDRPDVNPMHINPKTKLPFDPRRFTLKHGYDGLVDAMAKNILRAGKITDVGRAKMQARMDLNKATEEFNKKKGVGDIHKLPMPYRKNGSPGLHPAYKLTHYSEIWQKHPKHVGPGQYDTDVIPGQGMERTHPQDRLTHVWDPHTEKHVLATRSLSRKGPHGEKIEVDELHPFSELKDVIGDRYAFPEYETKGGGINADVMMEDPGGGTRGWRRYHMNQDPHSATHGGGASPDQKVHRGLDGRGYDMLRAVMSLHPKFFERGSYHEKTVLDRREYLEEIFEDAPAGLLPVLDELAWTPVGELLTEPFRGGRVARSQRGVFKRALADVKRLVGVPTDDEAHEQGPDSDAWASWKSFDDNADNMHIIMHEWQKAYSSLSKALYATVLAKRQGALPPSQLQLDMAAYLPHITAINPAEIKDIPFNPGGGAKFREMTPGGEGVTPRHPFAPPASKTPGAAVGGGEPIIPGAEENILLSVGAMDDAWLFIKEVCC